MLLAIKKEASEFRITLGFGNTEPIQLKSLLMRLNVITVFKELSDTFSGMAIRAGDFRFMIINSNHSIGRQNFSICHELYHLYVDGNFLPHHCNSGLFDKNKKQEYNADIFASYFLMPDDGITRLIPQEELVAKDKITIETILRIEQSFGCSRSALLFRLKELGIISAVGYDHFKQNVKLLARQYGYPTELYEPGNKNLVIGDYAAVARHLYDAGKISEGHYTALLQSIGLDILNVDDNGAGD